ncbi:MAG: hypothetical protein CVV62_02255 [Tenericutes bacterium HGW-Tenericutes-7]|nr:MAG: hypothetical protein CVV62_02255 [Tenericutes bacterium HGW-Tenericutes-7]
MTLQYKEYLSKALIWPSIYLLVAIFLIVLLFLYVTNKITLDPKYKIFIYIFLILMSFGLIFESVPTIKYSIYLLVENKSNANSSAGEIIQIEDAYNSPRYYYEGNNGLRAKIITIDDEKFYIFYIGNFKVGDTVVIEYLPKSTFVLSINYE